MSMRAGVLACMSLPEDLLVSCEQLCRKTNGLIIAKQPQRNDKNFKRLLVLAVLQPGARFTIDPRLGNWP